MNYDYLTKAANYKPLGQKYRVGYFKPLYATPTAFPK